MIILMVSAFVMVATALLFSYLELLPFINAVERDFRQVLTVWNMVTFAFKVIGHTPKLIPCAIDIVVTVFLSGVLGFGTGLIGAITGLFAANVVSLLVYYHTHIKRRKYATTIY
jgi:hypothetical protein